MGRLSLSSAYRCFGGVGEEEEHQAGEGCPDREQNEEKAKRAIGADHTGRWLLAGIGLKRGSVWVSHAEIVSIPTLF